MLRVLEVITTTHCTVFVLSRLLICLTKRELGLALSLPRPDVDSVSHNENRRCFLCCFSFGYTEKLVGLTLTNSVDMPGTNLQRPLASSLWKSPGKNRKLVSSSNTRPARSSL